MSTGLPQSFTYRDDKGQTATCRMFIRTGADAVAQEALAHAIELAITGLTNAAFQGSIGPDTEQALIRTYGANADYESVEDKAVFVFSTAGGAYHRYRVPAPKVAIFLADGETVDFTNALVIAYVNAMVAGVCDRNAVNITTSIGGYRTRVKNQRRFNVITRNPTLSGQGL